MGLVRSSNSGQAAWGGIQKWDWVPLFLLSATIGKRRPALPLAWALGDPWTDNGIKVFGGDGYKLSDEMELSIEKEIFRLMYDILLPGGWLVTYCSKGEIRRNMEAAGFKVEKLPGPKGKREMVKAMKIIKQ